MFKKLLLFICILLLSAYSYAGELSIGYGKASQWNSLGTSTNLQDTNITLSTSSDGYKVLAFNSPTNGKDWTSLTGWTEETEAGADSAILNSQLNQYANTVAKQTALYRYGAGVGYNSFTYVSKVALTVASTITSTTYSNRSGLLFVYVSPTHYSYTNIRSDGTYFNIFDALNGGTCTSRATTAIADTRYHLISIANNNTTDGTIMAIDGQEYVTDGYCAALGSSYTETDVTTRKGATETVNPQNNYLFTYNFNSITPYTTSVGTWESITSESIFDAGESNLWDRLSYSATWENGSILTLEARTSASASGLTSATYFIPTNNVTWDVSSKLRYLQIRARMTHGLSGRATPILKNVIAYNNTSGTVEANTTNFFRMW